MRGKLSEFDAKCVKFRNIPAYAGKTKGKTPGQFINAEHPRVCGENNTHNAILFTKIGTSPRMRGKPLPKLYNILRGRNIPAYAGKTCCWLRITSRLRGTSPRMRGKHLEPLGIVDTKRNIPAYAGKTR